jgi:hypothetical protein
MRKTITSEKVEVIRLKMLSGEDCVSELHGCALQLQAGLAIRVVPGVPNSPDDKGDNHNS